VAHGSFPGIARAGSRTYETRIEIVLFRPKATVDETGRDGIIRFSSTPAPKFSRSDCVAFERRLFMAGPQFFTPKSVRPSRPRRRFTLEQANKSLPLVRRIVTDIVRTHAEASRLQQQFDRLNARDQKSMQQRVEAVMHRLEDYVDELSEIGCELKDYQAGLIDFTGRHDGRDISLCWKLGEEKITHWHEIDAGFAGRKPVSLLKQGE
jgi:hypothetical protein